MFLLCSIAVVLGWLVGIKLTLGAEILIFVAVFILANWLGADKELGIIIYWIFALFFGIGMLAADIYVLFAFPAVREAGFAAVSNFFKWLFTPSGI